MIAQTAGRGTPLVLIHGFAVDHRIRLPLEDMIGERPWRRVYLDLPWAEGAVDTGVATPRELADAVLDEVVEIAAGGPFAVLGSSFGAMVARQVAHVLREQCVGLATLAGVFEMDRARRTLPEELAGHAVPAAFRALARHVAPGIRGADQAVLERLGQRYAEAYHPETDAEVPFDAPALHVLGRQDDVVGFEDGTALRRHYVRGTVAILDGAGHNLHLERPEVVGALVRDWLDRVEVGGTPGSPSST